MVFHFICKIRLLTWLTKPHVIRPQAHLRSLSPSLMMVLPFHTPFPPVPLAIDAHSASGPLHLLFPLLGGSSSRSSPGRLLILQSLVQVPPPPFSAYPVSCCPLLHPSHSLSLYPVLFSWRHNHYLNLVIGLLGYCLSCPNRMEAS